jgi:UDP-glucose 4-epimerase
MSAAGRRLAVTGISTFWGTELARRLERDPEVEYIVGIDSLPPSGLARTDFVEADIRNPVLGRLLPTTGVDTVVHCGILWYPEPDRPASTLHEINVIGTLQLLAACERAETVRRVIVRGSAAIYGSEGASPYFFTEDLASEATLRTRFQRDVFQLERYFENFAGRRPDLVCCMLRYQPEIGPELDSPLVRYLTLPVVPVQLGFDPRLQFLHADDATAALEAAVRDPVRGAVNVAPDGAISLSRALRLLGRPSLPIPHPLFAATVERLGRRLGAGGLVRDGVRLLRYGRGVDNRRLREEVGFEPRYSAAAAVRDLAAKARSRRLAAGPELRALARVLGGVAR